jgi:formylglycine-generating enzyme required for sulfatase activity
MVLLGGPGSGKSTCSNYLALCLAGARLEQAGKSAALPSDGWLDHLRPTWSHGPLLPLQITLRHFGQSEWCDGSAGGLWHFVTETLAAQGLADFAPHLRQFLLDGGVLVLLDGLDEVADPEQRKAVLKAVADFADTYGHRHNRCLVICRGYAYRDPYRQLERFADHTLAPFSQEQIDAFIDCWYKEVCRLGWKSEAEAEDLTRRLQRATRRADLAPLAGSPLQLTMMASLHFSWGQLPEDRVELYQEMMRLLLVRWQEARLGEEVGVTQAVSASKLESALEQVAYEAHHAQGEGEGTADISEGALRSVLKEYLEGSRDRAGELVSYIQQRAGLLLERGPGVYTFPHRSYQEYLAGAYLAVQPGFPDEAAALIGENSGQWREVVLWAVGVMARLKKMTHVAVDVASALCPGEVPTGAVAEAAWRAAQLAGEALLEIGVEEVQARERHREVLARVRRWLVDLLRTGALEARERADAGNLLARLGDPRFRADAWYLPDEPLLGLVEVPSGLFIMGEGRKQHELDLPPFHVARYPVTVAQFAACVQDSDFQPGAPDSLRGEANHPVVWVSWHEALKYCQWLTERLRGWEGTPEPLATLLREGRWAVTLPSEAQWEKAARGTDWRQYPWGEEADPKRANYSGTGIGTTTAVGLFPAGASPYGLLDMAGNVWEWCSSLYADYPYSADDGREKPEAFGARVLRGGSWLNGRGYARCAYRYGYHPDDRSTSSSVFGLWFPPSCSDC